MRTYMHLLSVVLLLSISLCSGCLVPPVLFPKTGAHGLVLDQFGQRVPHAKMKASWFSTRFTMFEPSDEQLFATATDGSWKFYKRKVDELFIEVLPQEGYERVPNTYQISLTNGKCPTNEIILRVMRVQPSAKPETVEKSN